MNGSAAWTRPTERGSCRTRYIVYLFNNIHSLYCLYNASIRYAGMNARKKSYYYYKHTCTHTRTLARTHARTHTRMYTCTTGLYLYPPSQWASRLLAREYCKHNMRVPMCPSLYKTKAQQKWRHADFSEGLMQHKAFRKVCIKKRLRLYDEKTQG